MKFPIFIELELTNHCNLRCIMCPHDKMTREKGYMHEDVFYKVIREARGKAKQSYLHQIGEPLMHPELVPFINRTSDSGIWTSISTNGMFLDEPRRNNLIKSKLDELVICIDATDEETYDKIRRGGDYYTVVQNTLQTISMRRDLERGPEIVVQFICMNENKGQMKRFEKHWGHKLKDIGRVWLKGYSTFAGKVKKGEEIEPRRFNCNKPNTHITVQWNGDVVPCCRDYNGDMVLGNVKYDTIEHIWNSEKYQRFRENLFSENFPKLCEEC